MVLAFISPSYVLRTTQDLMWWFRSIGAQEGSLPFEGLPDALLEIGLSPARTFEARDTVGANVEGKTEIARKCLLASKSFSLLQLLQLHRFPVPDFAEPISLPYATIGADLCARKAYQTLDAVAVEDARKVLKGSSVHGRA